MKFVAGSGSCFNPVYQIKGRIANHVKDESRKYFVSAEFTHELHTADFWNELSQLAKTHNRFIELYVQMK